MSYLMNDAIRATFDRWCKSGQPFARGELFEQVPDVHGEILIAMNLVDDLNGLPQVEADSHVADALGTSITHAILLRQFHDRGGHAGLFLSQPHVILGDQAGRLFDFWARLDDMKPEAWDEVAQHMEGRDLPFRARRAWADIDKPAAHFVLEAWETCAAREAQNERQGRCAWNGRHAAYAAMAEIAGARWLPAHERGEMVFLPMFGEAVEP